MVCVRLLVCICATEGSKQFQLWPQRKDVLFEDIWASALLQIRGLKLRAACWSKGIDIVDVSNFVFLSLSPFLFVLYIVHPSILFSTSCTAPPVSLNQPIESQTKNILVTCTEVFSPWSSICHVDFRLTFFSLSNYVVLSVISACNPIDNTIFVYTEIRFSECRFLCSCLRSCDEENTLKEFLCFFILVIVCYLVVFFFLLYLTWPDLSCCISFPCFRLLVRQFLPERYL